MIVCPKCHSDKIIPVGTTHYMCNNDDCIHLKNNGYKPQFRILSDEYKHFPYDQIFNKQPSDKFYRYDYIESIK